MSSDPQEKLLDEEQSIDDQSEDHTYMESRRSHPSNWRTYVQPWRLAFGVSVLLNIILVLSNSWPEKFAHDVSIFAKLPRNIPLTFDPYSKYGVGNSNETDRSVLWENLTVSTGSIALDLQWAKEMGLPGSQPFPWDHSKGIYLVSGHHNLHCLRKVRRWVTISYHNGTQLDSYSHVVHCLGFLLDNIMCEADDTPIYSTKGLKKDAGYHQTRQCRSWDALNEWAESQTACYGFINETQGVSSLIERYKYCPEGSPYAEKVRDRLGLPANWFEKRPSEMESVPPYWEDFKNNEFVFHELTDQ